MLIQPGSLQPIHRRKDFILSLPSLMAYYDSVLSKPVLLPDGKVERLPDLSSNGLDLRVRTDVGKIHPTYDNNAFGDLPGIGNSLQGQKVELRGDDDIRPFLREQQTWFFVYRRYRITNYRILSLGTNYETPIDHWTGLAWGRSETNGFPKTNLSLETGAVCTCRFLNSSNLLMRVNGADAPQSINPRDTYFSTNAARNIHLFTGYNLAAVEGVFGAVIFCMEALPMPLVEKVERYLSQRFSIPLTS